jgi:hypothetical protein
MTYNRFSRPNGGVGALVSLTMFINMLAGGKQVFLSIGRTAFGRVILKIFYQGG